MLHFLLGIGVALASLASLTGLALWFSQCGRTLQDQRYRRDLRL